MKSIPDAHKKVPMMFRAQVRGRSQLQYPDPKKRPGKPREGEPQDVERWVDEWINKAELRTQAQVQDVQTQTYGARSYQISWRFVTNGGQDDGMLRPVIGSSGIPFYPGSSMKGAFRQACRNMEQDKEVETGTCDHYCGSDRDLTPGILRFLGAYPTNDWTEGLLDLVHPQQGWQVKTLETRDKPKRESAYAQVSLYQPTLRFAISSSKPLSSEQWEQIWQIWERAIATGLGSKVSNGYGQISETIQPVIFQAKLKGQGQVSQRIDGTGEFRPNIIRAALRGHALRIFGGLTTEKNADQLVDKLFGSVRGHGHVGLLGLSFQVDQLDMKVAGGYDQPTYNVEGEVTWFLTQHLPNREHIDALKKLMNDLMWFAMVLGGFGKSWRRPDHTLFYPEDDYQKLIGCHWQWADNIDRKTAVRVWKPDKIGAFIDSVRDTAQAWIKLQGAASDPEHHANWREAFHPSRVCIFGRVAKTRDDCVAIDWLHQPYQRKIASTDTDKTIKATSITGKIGRIGRLWHRMYPPTVRLVKLEKDKKPSLKPTNRFIEILTIFPDGSPQSNDFLEFLDTNPEGFEQLWGDR